jgi:peptidyl-prolyl cis-trans isomerase SurA
MIRSLCYNKNLVLLLILLVMLAPATLYAAGSESIAAIVNQEAISASDVNDRMELIMKSSGLPNVREIREKLKPQILSGLIEEQIKFQEMKAKDVTVTEAEIQSGFAQLATQNKIPADQFKEMLGRSGLNVNTMYNQIRAQIGWSKVVQKVLFPQVIISDADVDDATNRIKNNLGKTEFLAAEIFLPFESAAQSGDIQDLANRLAGEIKAGKAPFFKVAQQFSKAAGASKGGDMGWIQEGQLDPAIDAALNTLEKNGISAPIRTSAGYHILFLRDKRTITEASMPSVQDIRNTIGMERLERLQRRYFMDLKSSAFIETRV